MALVCSTRNADSVAASLLVGTQVDVGSLHPGSAGQIQGSHHRGSQVVARVYRR